MARVGLPGPQEHLLLHWNIVTSFLSICLDLDMALPGLWTCVVVCLARGGVLLARMGSGESWSWMTVNRPTEVKDAKRCHSLSATQMLMESISPII
jgi:hypothetical protein